MLWRMPSAFPLPDQNPQNSGSKILAETVHYAVENGRSVVMKEADVNKYRTLLMTERAAIVGRAPEREELWIVPSNEQIETVQLAGQREFAARTLEREAKSLMLIGAALKRIEDGEFGICLDCEEPISAKRLAAVPWAAYCLHCQEIHDAEEARDKDDPKLAA
jgi:DnaK suppressor protein